MDEFPSMYTDKLMDLGNHHLNSLDFHAIDAFISISKAVPHACGSVGFHFFADLVVDSKGRVFWSELNAVNIC